MMSLIAQLSYLMITVLSDRILEVKIMALLSILGGIGSALGIIGSGISLFSGGKKGSSVSSAGTAINNAATSLSGVSAQQAGVQGAAEQAALSRDTFEYQKNLQQQIFQREDNAVQRRVRDLEAAGLSRTLAAGSAAGAGQAIRVDTPQSASLLKGQALAQGIQNMLNISQSKANIALTEAQAKKTLAEAGAIGYDFDWYQGAGLPTGAKSGIVFLLNSIASNLGISNKQAVSVLTNVVFRIAKKFGIDFSEASSLFGEAVNKSPSSINAIVSAVGKSASVGISNHLGISIDPISSDYGFDFSTKDVENKVYSWADKVLDKRSLKKYFKNNPPDLKYGFNNGGGRVW